jgi:hypothetical protein
MRLPQSLRELPGPAVWMPLGVGIVLLAIVIFVGATWGSAFREVGAVVLDNELPRARFPGWGEARCLSPAGAFGLSVDRRGAYHRVAPERLESWIRAQDRDEAFVVRAHRHAPWSSVARVVDAAGRARRSFNLQISGGYRFLSVIPVPVLEGPPGTVVTLTSLPLADPDAIAAAARELPRPLVVRLDLEAGVDVEAVLQALECYARDSGSVVVSVGP